MHLKDLKQGVATGSLSGHTDVSNDVALGTGQLNFAAILKAAKKAGIKHYFIEDESPTSVEQIPQSLKYLKTVKW
jgi:sugar phosphate isomerase/epimerase